MRNTLETRLGLFVALALIVSFIVMEMVGSFDFMKPGVHVRARFRTVQELNEGDPVKLGGFAIGRVEKIVIVENQVEVRMKLEQAEKVKTDSQAAIRFSGLLGQNYVSLSFGSTAAAPVTTGTLLESLEQPDLGTLMTRLDNVASGIENITRSFSGDQIQNLLGPFTDFLKENSPKLTAILGSLQTVSGRIAEGQGTLGRIISDDALYQSALSTVTNFDLTATELRTALADAKTLLGDLQGGQGTLGKLAKDDALYREAATAMSNLRQILEKINQGEGTVGKIVNDDTFYKNARLSLQKLDKATESLEDQGPLSLIGIAIGTLF